MKKILSYGIVVLLMATGCSLKQQDKKTNEDTQTISFFHLNDIHSHIPQEKMKLKFDGLKVKAVVGGMPRVITKLKQLKAKKPNSLILNAGDTFQGTMYFTLFNGKADTSLLNLVSWDAIELGNHEFDKGDDFLAKYIDDLNPSIPILGANVVPKKGNILKNKWKPYIIKNINGSKVGIIGIDVVEKTIKSSNPSDEITFLNEEKTAQKYINELKSKGIEKIILLTHVGFKSDIKLAQNLKGVDVIVGGDSHTLLGDFSAVGLKSVNPKYPIIKTSSEGKKVCIVQAWNYAYVVGDLDVTFDKNGDVVSCKGTPTLLLGDEFVYETTKKDGTKAKIKASGKELEKIKNIIKKYDFLEQVKRDEQALKTLEKYKKQLSDKEKKVIGKAKSFLGHVRIPGTKYNGIELKNGSDIAPIVAKSFYDLSKEADICIQNGGGVRISINKGDITIGLAYELLPFSNTLYNIKMKGSEIKQVLEDALSSIYDDGGSTGAFPYAYALKYDIDISKGKNKRISNLEVKSRKTGKWSGLDADKMYVVVTNSYTANGKDGYKTFKTVQDKRGKGVDTYLDYALSFVDLVEKLNAKGKGLTKLPKEDYSTKSFKK